MTEDETLKLSLINIDITFFSCQVKNKFVDVEVEKLKSAQHCNHLEDDTILRQLLTNCMCVNSSLPTLTRYPCKSCCPNTIADAQADGIWNTFLSCKLEISE